LCAVAGAGPARAVEALDGRLQLHGFFEIQNRILAQDFEIGQDSHLAQWWNILNLELEWDAAPEGWGPFDLVSTYVRAELRYDLVYQAQYYLPNYLNRYGDDARRLPRRLSDAREPGLIGQVDPGSFSDERNFIQLPMGERADPYGAPAGLGQDAPRTRHLGNLWNVPALGALFFAGAGPDRIWGIDPRNGQTDDSGLYVGERFAGYRFGAKRLPGNLDGDGAQVIGPYRPQDVIPDPGILRDRANPLRGPQLVVQQANGTPALFGGAPRVVRGVDVRPALKDAVELDPDVPLDELPNSPATPALAGTTGELPYRPAPFLEFAQPGSVALADLSEAQGLYLPNAGYRRLLLDEDLRFHPDSNFEEWELALNWGASQQPWRELKEAYVDIEVFEHHLWLRVGRQTIVWGKTELFRAQDQFNPQDVGIASLPSLEESRVPLWSARAVWSFYDVGPLEDVRLEAAFNWDEFYPIDAGRCGEPFAPRPACTRSYGFFANSLVGTGLAGEYRTSWPWEDVESLEGGLRLEFRSGRMSYALTWFNGFEDVPHAEPVFVFERNVDPASGRPRLAGSRGRCDPEGVAGAPDSSACLGIFALDANGNPDYGDPVLDDLGNVVFDPTSHLSQVLDEHHANQQLFHTICGATVGFLASLLPEGCGFNVWNSVAPSIDPDDPDISPVFKALAPRLSMAFSVMIAGQGPRQTPFPPGNLLRDINGKTILYTVGRFQDYTCQALAGVDCGGDDEDDMPLVPLVRDPGDSVATPSTALNCGATTNPDDAWACERMRMRFGGPDPAAESVFNLWRTVGVARFLNDEQEALIGCGRFWGTDCDVDGFDLFGAEANVLFQSWPGFEGTGPFITLTSDAGAAQPGTVGFAGGPICTRYENGLLVTIAGCFDGTPPSAPQLNPGALPRGLDGGGSLVACPGRAVLPTGGCAPVYAGGHPFTGQAWQSELAALSWNLLVTLVTLSVVSEDNDSGILPNGEACQGCIAENGLDDSFEDIQLARGLPRMGRFDDFDPLEPMNAARCSYVNPLICRQVVAVLQLSGQAKATRRAGGNGRFGRRDFLWHGGAQVVLDYQRRNVVGLATDFAEDRSGTNWNLEFTWFDSQQFLDNDSFGVSSDSDTLNLTVSVDRPTFVRFLNRNRTFFINSQLFVRWIMDYRDSYTVNGPVDAIFTLGVFTGYFQDRLIPSAQLVYDIGSQSGGFLYGFGFRVTQSFLIQIGLNAFWGRVQQVEAPLLPLGTAGAAGAGLGQQHAYVENGLSTIRDRDELFFRIRYTF
jgi:hypothetical protein